MELDFTKLNSIGEFNTAPEITENPTSPFNEKDDSEGIRQLQRQADKNKAEAERIKEVYTTYQNNIKTSGALQTEILKGLKMGEDIYRLFLKAVKAISLMTSNSVFYTQSKQDIRIIYGIGLQEKVPLQLEIKGVETRLKRLQEALISEDDADDRGRIETAIKLHKEKIEKLSNLIVKQ